MQSQACRPAQRQGPLTSLLCASLGAAEPATPSPGPDRRPRAAARQARDRYAAWLPYLTLCMM